MAINVRPLAEADIEAVVDAAGGRGWRRERTYWQACLAHQAEGERVSLIARVDGAVAGYAQLFWRAQYGPFVEARIPEISDLRVGERFRRHGVGAAILRRCERLARAKGRTQVGIGVGLEAEFGPAQRLYARLGYQPDGRGATTAGHNEPHLWLVKPLAGAPRRVGGEPVVARPTPCAGVVCLRGDDVLLIRRGKAPRLGEWSIPGGRMEMGEGAREAALRELAEETGVTAELLGLIDVVDLIAEGRQMVLVDYAARWVAGEPVGADDAAEARFFPLDEALGMVSWSETRRIIREAVARFGLHPLPLVPAKAGI